MSTWAKIVYYAKITFFVILGLVLLIIVSRNWNATVEPALDLLFVKFEHPPLLRVLLITGAISIFGWWLFFTIFRTLRQMREGRDRSRIDKLERQTADIRAKAAMLQTRPAQTSGAFQVDKLDGSGSETR